MFPLLIPLIVIGSILLGAGIAALCKKARKIAIFGTTESGKTTLWRALQGLPVGGSYYATVDRAGVRSFKFHKSNGDTVTVAKGYDIPGKDEIFQSACDYILNEDKTVVLFLVSAMDVMCGNVHESGGRLRRIKMIIEQLDKCAIILILTHKRDFVSKYGEGRISGVIGKAHEHFDKYTKNGYDLVELTNSTDVSKIKDLF